MHRFVLLVLLGLTLATSLTVFAAPRDPMHEATTTMVLFTPSVTCEGRYEESVHESFKDCKGVKSVTVSYIKYHKDHGPARPFNAATARIKIVLGKSTDARALTKAMTNLNPTVITFDPKK